MTEARAYVQGSGTYWPDVVREGVGMELGGGGGAEPGGPA